MIPYNSDRSEQELELTSVCKDVMHHNYHTRPSKRAFFLIALKRRFHKRFSRGPVDSKFNLRFANQGHQLSTYDILKMVEEKVLIL